ncbi:hypothetical protein J4H86_24975 [Spiractinospora alimapuensis]|uniref:methyltransferase n=1 Tax=Spiractinospora alimapuensis TaxID=2820884 RepID=UPI001F23C447|nr:methyltransferase [Spiractinospora alimapuensis]QVQ51957.1 hypothetical protein J4H86_24975 [Spiractinospora alimapuensis]
MSSGTLDKELMGMITGYMPAFTIRAALQLGIPAAIGESTVTAAELARVTSTHEPSLIRMLRTLAALEVLVETMPGSFALAPRGRLLLPGVPGSQHDSAMVILDESMWGAWPILDQAIRTGESAFDCAFGTDYMTYTGYAEGSEIRDHVDQALIDETRAVAPFVVNAFDFRQYSTFVDIGGGSGALAAALIVAHPHLRGTVFDTDNGAALAPRLLTEAGVADRCEVRTGDFFTEVPVGDVFVCKSVLFNWANDEHVSTILDNCRWVIPDNGRLLLIEQMLPPTVDGSMPADVYVDDLNSVVSLGGRRRAEPEYRVLLSAAGFDMIVHPLPSAPYGYVMLEAVPI